MLSAKQYLTIEKKSRTDVIQTFRLESSLGVTFIENIMSLGRIVSHLSGNYK